MFRVFSRLKQAIESLGTAVAGNPRIAFFRRSLARAYDRFGLAAPGSGQSAEHAALCTKVAGILAAHAGAAFAATPADETAGPTTALSEIVVTAQRRSENIQDVPIAIQALTGETLPQLNVSNFDDFVKYLPNVTASSSGPGQSLIFMRGLSTGFQGIQSGGSINGFPNVAVYLDDQSGQLPGRNLDVYTAELERVEVIVYRAEGR